MNENEEKICNIYSEILYREPDEEGLKHFLKKLNSKKITEKDIRDILLNSEEKQALESKNIQKEISEIYNEVLYRNPDKSALCYYCVQLGLKKLSRLDIKEEIRTSDEFMKDVGRTQSPMIDSKPIDKKIFFSL